MDHEKIIRGIISDLMKVPMAKPEEEMPHAGSESGMESMEPKAAHIEIMAAGKPKDMADVLDPDHDGDIDHIPGMKPMHSAKQNKMLHAMGHKKI